MSGCGEEEGEGTSTTQGWHFQGRDCLACHNVDLGNEKHLLFGGTLYKSDTITNQDDTNNMCGGDLIVNFIDTNGSVIYSSKDYKVADSKGYKAKGNLFILKRALNVLSPGSYYVQVTDTNGSVLAVTSSASHQFDGQNYDINNRSNSSNRVACNACHSNTGSQKPLYVNNTANLNLCQ